MSDYDYDYDTTVSELAQLVGQFAVLANKATENDTAEFDEPLMAIEDRINEVCGFERWEPVYEDGWRVVGIEVLDMFDEFRIRISPVTREED